MERDHNDIYFKSLNRKLFQVTISATVSSDPELEKHPTLPLVYQKNRNPHQVPILSGGGSGHEPAHIGYVGEGMLTAAIYGQLFTPPTRTEILESIRFFKQWSRCLHHVKKISKQTSKNLARPLTLLEKKELKLAIV